MADAGALIVVDIGAERYAVPAAHVQAALRLPALGAAPDAPPQVIGLLNLHERTLPVIDLHRCLGRRPPPYTLDDTLLVLELRDGLCALRISETAGMVEPAPEQLDPAPSFQSSGLFGAVARIDGVPVPLINPDGLLMRDRASSGIGAGTDDFSSHFDGAARQELARRASAARIRSGADDSGHCPFVLVRIEQELFAIELSAVRGFAALDGITSVPCCPEHILGYVNLHGEVVVAVDLRPLLGIPRSSAHPLRHTVIASLMEGKVALPVHELLDVMALEPSLLGKPPAAIAGELRRFCKGTCPAASGTALLLDLTALLSEERVTVNESP